MTIINAAHLSHLSGPAQPAQRRPAGAWSKHTHAPDAGRGLTLCGKRGAPVGAAPTCANCRRALAARERRAVLAAMAVMSDPLADLADPMAAAGWKRNRRGEYIAIK